MPWSGGLLYSDSGQLNVTPRPGSGMPATGTYYLGGWARNNLGYAYVEDAGAAVPASAVCMGGRAYTPDGALYVTSETPTGTLYSGGIRIRTDGAVYVKGGTPGATDPIQGLWARSISTGQAYLGGLSFWLPLSDAGAGAVNTTPAFSAGSPTATFTRATTATTIGSTGLVIKGILANVARSYYDPTTLEYLGYMSEGARTNLCRQSEDLGTSWTNTRSTNSLNATTAPDGTATADKLVEDATAANTHLIATPNWTDAAATYVFSVWAKAAERTRFTLSVSSSHLAGGANGSFNLTAGTATNGTNATASIKAYPNGWYRCSITYTTTLSAAAANFINLADASGNVTYNGDGVSGAYFWGAQIELGAFLSSYIPTTTGSVARNADVLTYVFAGNADAAAGSCYAELTFMQPTAAVSSPAIAFDNSTGWPLSIGSGSAATVMLVRDGTNAVTKTGLTDASSVARKRMSSWGSAGQSVTGDGVAPATGLFDGATGSTGIGIGIRPDGATAWFGTLKGVRIYASQLPDATLQALTA